MPTLNKAFGLLAIILFVSCSTKESLTYPERQLTLRTKADTLEYFNWEVTDYMPTPPSQSIRVPWATGSGGLDAFYGLDVLYDHKSINGWRLMYSSFRSTGAALIDPYFVLYNVYRGTLRIYIYMTSITTSFSSYIQDVVYLNGLTSSHILNYLGSYLVDTDAVVQNYNSVRAKPLSGGSPLANNQWYMVEYELAYDPNLGNVGCNQLRFQLNTQYYQIDSIRLSGEMKTELSGTVGANSTTAMDLVHSEWQSAKKGVAGILGASMLSALGVQPPDQNQSNNKVGIKDSIFSNLVSAVNGMASSFFSGIPSFAYSLLNAIICGSSSSAGSTVSLKAETSIQFKGTQTSSGALGNISMFIPGTVFSGIIQGQVPLYDEILGVFYLTGNNILYMQQQTGMEMVEVQMGGGTQYYPEYYTLREIAFDPDGENYAHNLVFNPAVLDMAYISVISEDLVEINPTTGGILMNELELEGFETTVPFATSYPIPDYDYGVRFLIKVQPIDGSPASYIYKTFKLEPYLVGGRGSLSDEEMLKIKNKYIVNEKNK